MLYIYVVMYIHLDPNLHSVVEEYFMFGVPPFWFGKASLLTVQVTEVLKTSHETVFIKYACILVGQTS